MVARRRIKRRNLMVRGDDAEQQDSLLIVWQRMGRQEER
jgi:hypothetical protein